MKRYNLIHVVICALTSIVILACSEDSGVGKSDEIDIESSVETLDDLPDCTKNRLGEFYEVISDSALFVCNSKNWIETMGVYNTLENLPNCTEKLFNESYFVIQKEDNYTCLGEKWVKESLDLASSSSAGGGAFTGDDTSVYDASKNTLTDNRDGQIYKTVTFGNQTWMAENLNYAYSTSWCYENSAANCAKYGRLYTWSAAMDSAAHFSQNANTKCGYGKSCTPNTPHRGVCPEGWHIPNDAEWNNLRTSVWDSLQTSESEIVGTVGTVMRSTSGWIDEGGMDSYGFSVLPGGYRNDYGSFINAGEGAYFWSSSEKNQEGAISLTLSYEYFALNTKSYTMRTIYSHKIFGNSVRCLRDSSSSTSSNTIVNPATVETGILTDVRDSQTYKTVTIGTQTWMAENLNYAYTGVKYVYDGYTRDSTSWCYNNIAANCAKYGRLYSWSTAMDSAALFPQNANTKCGYGTTCTPNSPHRGVCPEGWHIPKVTEWNTLLAAVGGASVADSLLKSTSGWNSSYNGTDSYGFSIIPAGFRNYDDNYDGFDYVAYFLGSSEIDSSRVYTWGFNNSKYGVMREGNDKFSGFSVRCLRDSE